MNLLLTHYSLRQASKTAYRQLPFVTRRPGKADGPFYYGFEEEFEITAAHISECEKARTLERLWPPIPISLNQSLWLSPAGDIWLALSEDPVRDPARYLIARRDGKTVRFNGEVDLKASPIVQKTQQTGDVLWFAGSYLNTIVGPKPRIYDPLWHKPVKELVLKAIRKISSDLDIGPDQGNKIVMRSLQGMANRTERFEQLIWAHKVALPLEITFESALRSHYISVVPLGNADVMSLVFCEKSSVHKELELTPNQMYCEDFMRWTTALRRHRTKICSHAETSAEHQLLQGVTLGYLGDSMPANRRTVSGLVEWLRDHMDDGIVACDVGIGYQMCLMAKLHGAPFAMSFAKYEAPVPVGIPYPKGDPWGDVLKEVLHQVWLSEDQEIAESVSDTIDRLRKLRITVTFDRALRSRDLLRDESIQSYLEVDKVEV